uniref:Uncharacterized protein n=1 Tax=Arundo donax TaxID=35708 RepID=A0A0A9HXI0_ARUDO
MDLQSVAMVS